MGYESRQYAKATKLPSRGINVYIPKDELEKAGFDLEEADEVWVSRTGMEDGNRSKVLITLKDEDPTA